MEQNEQVDARDSPDVRALLVVWGLIAVGTFPRVRAVADVADVAVDVAILGAGDACAARVCGLGSVETIVQTCAVPNRPVRRESATRTFAELLIDCEEDRTFRAVLVGGRAPEVVHVPAVSSSSRKYRAIGRSVNPAASYAARAGWCPGSPPVSTTAMSMPRLRMCSVANSVSRELMPRR